MGTDGPTDDEQGAEPTVADAVLAADEGSPTPKKRHPLRWAALGAVVIAVGAAGVYAWKQVPPEEYRTASYALPEAPELTAEPGETIYRIDPTRSSLTYEIDERLVGQKAGTATGVTNGIAGDVAVNADDLAASRVGQIVVNVEQFHSDNNLRDARIRQDYLESRKHKLARFDVTAIDGLSGPLVVGEEHRFTMTGTVTIKNTTAEATFDATASVAADGTLTATATTRAKLSRFDAGPISIAGLVTTSDDVDLTLELTALDPERHAIPTRITGPDAEEPDASDAPSFGKVVQPIIENNCASCHTSGGMGSSHLSLDTAGDVQAISDGIKTVTQARYMPPWPASDLGVPLKHKTTLSDEDLAALAAWSDGGAPLDVPADTELVAPKPKDEITPRQDLLLERTEPYAGSLDNTNDYRCFLLDPKLTEPTFLTGYTFLPDQVEELHHAQVFHVSAQQVESSVAKDGKDGKPGWSCYAGPELKGKRPDPRPDRTTKDVGFPGQANLVAGWVPGQSPVVFPENSGILMQPGDQLVLQLHYHYSVTATPDTSTLALQLDPGDSDVRFLRVVNPLGPVEIPCLPEHQDEPLCDRDAALEENVRLYGPSGASNEAGLLVACRLTHEELQARFDGSVARTTCDLRVPEDGTIIGAMGHMHTLGKDFRLTLSPDTDDEQILLDIPRWSFDWQMNYALETPIHVKAGQTLRMDCGWDRAIDPLRTPKYIVFAEGTEDEMCFGTYSLIPDEQ